MLPIYCDKDDVLVDWKGYVLSKHFPKMSIEQLNKMQDRDTVLREMYHKDYRLFKNLPIKEGAEELVEFLSQFGFKVLTADGGVHPCPTTVAMDKTMAMFDKFNISPEDTIVVPKSSDKVKYAPNAILIDDYEKNIDAWNEAGGIGILYQSKEDLPKVKEVILNLRNNWDDTFNSPD